VIKVTGKTSPGGRRGGASITVGSGAPEILSFGPRTFTRGSSTRLYDENVDPAENPARARGLWSIAGDIAKRVAGGVVNTATRYRRPAFARARTEAYPLDYEGDIRSENLKEYRAVAGGIRPVYEADQSFLKTITGIPKNFVYGAYWKGRYFVDRHIKKTSPEQSHATAFHEVTHKLHPEIEDEAHVEAIGKAYALHLAKHDPSQRVRRRAWKAYRGFLETEQLASPYKTRLPTYIGKGQLAAA
jgi:hypothetical protein